MALVPTVTNANPSLSLLGGGGGGGGGGGSPTFSTVTTSLLNVSSIVAEGTGNYLYFDANIAQFSTGTTVQLVANNSVDFLDGKGVLNGVSTINSIPYPPPALPANISTFTTGGGYFGATPANFNNAPMTVVPNKNYLASMSVLDVGFIPQPNATDNFTISIEDATGGSYLANFNCAQLSTALHTNIARGFSVSGPYEAISTAANFVYIPSSNISCSTFMTTVGLGWLVPLN